MGAAQRQLVYFSSKGGIERSEGREREMGSLLKRKKIAGENKRVWGRWLGWLKSLCCIAGARSPVITRGRVLLAAHKLTLKYTTGCLSALIVKGDCHCTALFCEMFVTVKSHVHVTCSCHMSMSHVHVTCSCHVHKWEVISYVFALLLLSLCFQIKSKSKLYIKLKS